MARPLRIEYPGAWYHVMNRGRRREPIYVEKSDYKLFLKILKQTSELFQIEIHAYALIPNHYHLLVRTPSGNISRCMRHINGVYTQKINKKYRTDGSLFRGRFKAILIEEEGYLLEVMRYIHRNPYKAKLEDVIGEYEWCSQKEYMKTEKVLDFLHTDKVLKHFSDYEKEDRRKMKAFVNKEVPKDILKKLDGVKWPTMLGGKEFKKKIKERLKGKEIDKIEITGYGTRKEKLEDYKEEIERLVEFKKEAAKNIRARSKSLERRAVIYLLRLYGKTLKEIGAIMGGVGYVSVSRQFKIAQEEIERKTGCYKNIEKIREALKLHI